MNYDMISSIFILFSPKKKSIFIINAYSQSINIYSRELTLIYIVFYTNAYSFFFTLVSKKYIVFYTNVYLFIGFLH